MITLVLLPGLDGTGLAFADFIAALGPGVDTITVAYPRDVALSYLELEAVVRASLPQDRPFFLLAESFSGPIAIGVAAAAPPGLRGLILCCSFARSPRPWLAAARGLLGAVPVAALPNALLSFFVLGQFSTPARRQLLANVVGLVAPAALRARARAALSVDVSALLARIRVPLLYLRARADRVVPPAAAGLIAACVPEMKIVTLEAPHFLLQAVPTEAAGVVKEFIGRHTPSPGGPVMPPVEPGSTGP